MALIRTDGSLEPSWLGKCCCKILRLGIIPRHVAFIMDGNRRFASKKHVQRIEGHSKGFDKLAEVLKWCQDLGIPEVTVYAFSAENFKRSKDEVDSLMELARQKLAKMLEQRDQLREQGVKIRIIGELHKLPDDIQSLANEVMSTTHNHAKYQLNVCMAYTSRHEMVQALRDICWGLDEKLIAKDDVTDELLGEVLQISKVDLLIRTSGEIRLSDFLLWQCSYAHLSFVDALWPELSIWDFYGTLLQYQHHRKNTTSLPEQNCITNAEKSSSDTGTKDLKMKNFISKLVEKREKNSSCLVE